MAPPPNHVQPENAVAAVPQNGGNPRLLKRTATALPPPKMTNATNAIRVQLVAYAAAVGWTGLRGIGTPITRMPTLYPCDAPTHPSPTNR